MKLLVLIDYNVTEAFLQYTCFNRFKYRTISLNFKYVDIAKNITYLTLYTFTQIDIRKHTPQSSYFYYNYYLSFGLCTGDWPQVPYDLFPPEPFLQHSISKGESFHTFMVVTSITRTLHLTSMFIIRSVKEWIFCPVPFFLTKVTVKVNRHFLNERLPSLSSRWCCGHT